MLAQLRTAAALAARKPQAAESTAPAQKTDFANVLKSSLDNVSRVQQNTEKLVRDLLDLALERGGTDNITIIAARAPVRKRESA